MSETTQVCPECDRASATPRTSRASTPRSDDSDADWRCKDCGATFDDPVERPIKKPANGRVGLAGVLERADPGVVGR